MNTCDTWEFNSAKAKALRLKAEAHRWDARVCELLGDAQGALDYRNVAESLELSARGYDKWAREAPDAPVVTPPSAPVVAATPPVDTQRVAVVPVLDAPPAALACASRAPDYSGEVIDPEDIKRLSSLFAGKTVDGVLKELGIDRKAEQAQQPAALAVPAEPFGMLDSLGIAHEGNSSNFAWLLEKHRAGKPEWGNRRLLYLAPPSEGSSSADFIAGYCEGRRAAYDAVVNAMRSAPGAKEALAAGNKENNP